MFRLGKLSAAVISANAAMITTLAAGSAHAAPQEIEEVGRLPLPNVQFPSRCARCYPGNERKFPEEQNIKSFVDYVKYLPNVNAGGRGPRPE